MLDVIMSKTRVERDATSGIGRAVSYLEKHRVDQGLCIAAEILSVAYLGIKTFQAFRKNTEEKENDTKSE